MLDLDRLNNIVDNFIKDNDVYVKYLPTVKTLGNVIFNENIDVSKKEWSRTISLNESIKICFNFLKTIDEDLANQFQNIINSKDSDNLPYVNFISKEDNIYANSSVSNGRVYIYYDNSPYDTYVILHELLHKMNDYKWEYEDKGLVESYERLYFGEAVSMLGEEMLGKYMVKNSIITENDYNYRRYIRLLDVKECIRDIVIENELINMRKNNTYINYENSLNVLNKYDKNSVEYKILNDEQKDLRRIKKILEKKDMSFPVSQRYILGYALSEQLANCKDLNDVFKILHNEIGSIDSNVRGTCIDILSEYQDKKSR